MFRLILVFYLLSALNADLIEDLNVLFEKKRCIKASSLSLSQHQGKSVMLDKNVPETTDIKFEKPATSKVNELAQFNNITYSYELISEEGPAHNKIFHVVLKLDDETYKGSGSSLKKAKQAAASSALENTLFEHPPIKIKSEEEKSLTPTVVLNNVAMKLGIAVSYVHITDKGEQAIASYGSSDQAYGKSKSFSQKWNNTGTFRIPTEEPQVGGPFTVMVKVGESQFLGVGHTIQAARHEAATQALKNLEKEALGSVCASEETVEECKKKKESLKSPISRIYEAGQKHKLAVEFDVISESGKSHQKVFVTRCRLGDFVSEGQGHSKKESKKKAAENMLENLSKLPELLDGKEIIGAIGGKKKKKKRKNKIIKNNKNVLGQSVADMISSFWSVKDGLPTDDNKVTSNKRQDGHKQSGNSPKDKLLEVGNMLSVEVQFMDLSKYGDEFYTLVTLGMHPEHICLGKAITREESHQTAALHGLKLLHKYGLLDQTRLKENRVSFDGIYLEDFEEEGENVLDIEDDMGKGG